MERQGDALKILQLDKRGSPIGSQRTQPGKRRRHVADSWMIVRLYLRPNAAQKYVRELLLPAFISLPLAAFRCERTSIYKTTTGRARQ